MNTEDTVQSSKMFSTCKVNHFIRIHTYNTLFFRWINKDFVPITGITASIRSYIRQPCSIQPKTSSDET